VTLVRDDPLHPDPRFAALYQRFPDATDLWPWLELARAASPPVLYLGVGTGRLAVPLEAAGIELIGVDSHPDMLEHLRQRVPSIELVEATVESLQLDRRFDLVMAPSNILYLVERLRGAARHVAPGGSVAIELANPHWLRDGPGDGVRVLDIDGDQASLEVDYRLADGGVVTQAAQISLVWPEEVENWLAAAGLKLARMFGARDCELAESPSFYIIAAPVQ
jgi:SAM-dependent methyltransferase